VSAYIDMEQVKSSSRYLDSASGNGDSKVEITDSDPDVDDVVVSGTDEDEELKDNLASLKTDAFTFANPNYNQSKTNLNDVTGFNSDISQLPHDRTLTDPNSALKV